MDKEFYTKEIISYFKTIKNRQGRQKWQGGFCRGIPCSSCRLGRENVGMACDNIDIRWLKLAYNYLYERNLLPNEPMLPVPEQISHEELSEFLGI